MLQLSELYSVDQLNNYLWIRGVCHHPYGVFLSCSGVNNNLDSITEIPGEFLNYRANDHILIAASADGFQSKLDYADSDLARLPLFSQCFSWLPRSRSQYSSSASPMSTSEERKPTFYQFTSHNAATCRTMAIKGPSIGIQFYHKVVLQLHRRNMEKIY